MNRDSKAKRRLMVLTVAIVVQAICLAVLCFGDIGFDHPGKYGLDFGDFILVGGGYAATLILGLVLALVSGRLLLAALQLVPGVCYAGYFLL